MNEYDLENHCADLGKTCRFAITFGEVAVLHVGGQEMGVMREEGYSVDELREIAKLFGGYAKVVMLSDTLPLEHRENNEAAVLIIKNGVNLIMKDRYAKNKLYMEQQQVVYDKKFWNSRQKKTLNKRARYNTTFGPTDVPHSADYRQPTVNGFDRLEFLNQIKNELPKWFGPKAEGLNAEGNFYFEEKSGIGFHGDAERKIVLCVCLGTTTTLRYCWRWSRGSKLYGKPIDVTVEHGDIYLMSEKATGNDWRKTSKIRLVHAAGNKKYITHK